MRKILFGIGLVFSLTVSVWAHDSDVAKVDVLVKLTSSWDGRDLPQYPAGAPEITVLKITIPPKVQLPLHKHPVINAGVLLIGELTVITEDKETLHLNPLRAKLLPDYDRLARYPYCGHAVVLGQRKNDWQDAKYVLGLFGKRLGTARAIYSDFVEKNRARATPGPSGRGLIAQPSGMGRSQIHEGSR